MYSLFASDLPGTLQIAICRNGQLQKYQRINAKDQAQIGTIFLARVQKVLPGIGAAIVRLGDQGEAFLNWGKGAVTVVDGGTCRHLKQVKEGQAVLGQFSKPPLRDKLAVLQGELKFTGFFSIYLPFGKGIRFSRQFQGGRQELTNALQEIPGGFIVRSAANKAPLKEIIAEANRSQANFEIIKQAIHQGKSRVLWKPDPILNLLQEAPMDSWRSIYFDDEERYQALRQNIKEQYPALLGQIKLHMGNQSLFDTYKLEDALEDLLKQTLYLKSGGSIHIHQSEAVVTIDVDTGKHTNSKGGISTALRSNLEAVEVIAQQIRARQLAGLIVIDFVNARDRGWRKTVNEALTEALKDDPQAVDIVGVNELGVATLARQRGSLDINHTFNISCPSCQGTGWIKSLESQAIDIQKRLLSEGEGRHGETLQITARRALAEYLKQQHAVLFSALEAQFGIKIQVAQQTKKTNQRWEIS